MHRPQQLSATRAAYDFAELAIAAVSGLALTVTAVYMLAMPLAHNMAGSRDFVAYWATGQQLAHHANPYDSIAMMQIEHSAGLAEGGVLLMRNPPWALPIALPLGFLGLRIAAVLWSLVLLACLMVSVRLIRSMHGCPRNPIHFLGYSSTPALICLIMGQTSLFALLGLVLFLRFYRNRPFVAGTSLWLCALKPHLFLPFAVVLVAWILVHKRYKLLVGATLAMAASGVAAYAIDHTAWTQYLEMMRAPAVQLEFIPCLSDALRMWLRPQTAWLQYLPAILTSVWALRYFQRRRQTWDWNKDGSLLMLLSIVAAPYCFLYDQGLAIPALLEGAYTTRSRKLVGILAIINILIGIELGRFAIISAFYLWTAPAWLAWFLIAGAAGAPTDRSQKQAQVSEPCHASGM